MTTSVSAPVWNGLFNLYLVIALIVAALVLGWFAFTLVRFRARGDAPDPRDAPRAGVIEPRRGHAIWSVLMTLVIAGVLFALAFGTLDAVKFIETPPDDGDALHVNLTAMQFGWFFDYEQGFRTYNELRVPVGTPVVLNVTSRDVFHNFAVPDYRIRIDAIPGEITRMWFQAEEPGTARTMCAELCGAGHAYMKGTIVAMEPSDFDAWIAEKTGANAPATNSTTNGGMNE